MIQFSFGMVVISDAIDGELGGSRLLMHSLGDFSSGLLLHTGETAKPHIIKPMLWKGDLATEAHGSAIYLSHSPISTFCVRFSLAK